jgi:plastocyanin
LAADGFPAGRAYAGAVCSNIFRNSFGHAYTPTTRMQATDPATWGFSSANEIFTIADIRVGDCLITWPSGGHIEGVYEKTGTTVTLFEMTHDGPTWTTYTNAEFMALVANKPYGLFRFDYENATIDYTPDPYSPITGEDVVAVEHDDVVTTEYGYGFNYASGDTVDIQIKSSDVTNYTIRRDGSVIETAATAGNTTISKTYTTAGDYSVTCTMTGGGESIETRFQVCKMEGSLSASSVASGSPVTFTFDAENCIPHTILIADQANRSISNGMIHEVTDAERLAGSATFTFPTVGSWMVRPRAEHQGGAVFPSNVNNFPLTIT